MKAMIEKYGSIEALLKSDEVAEIIEGDTPSTPEGKKFRDWITKELLPSIIRYGGYIYCEEEDEE